MDFCYWNIDLYLAPYIWLCHLDLSSAKPMVENTRLKDVQANLKKLIHLMGNVNAEYLHYHRAGDLGHLDQLEAHLGSLNYSVAISGWSTSNISPILQPFQVWNIKLDFPCFDGTNVLPWIFKAEQYFDYYSIPQCSSSHYCSSRKGCGALVSYDDEN